MEQGDIGPIFTQGCTIPHDCADVWILSHLLDCARPFGILTNMRMRRPVRKIGGSRVKSLIARQTFQHNSPESFM